MLFQELRNLSSDCFVGRHFSSTISIGEDITKTRKRLIGNCDKYQRKR